MTMTALVVRGRVPMAPAILSGLAVAMILLAMPVGFVETVVASSGLSEAWSAAGPPLGMKARLLLAAFGAIMAMGFVWTSQERDKGRRNGVAGVDKMGFALSKLGWLSRRRTTATPRGLRRADAHPDAPVRAPIFASRDFGGIDIFPRPAVPTPPADGDEATILPLPRLRSQQVVDAEFEEIVDPAPVVPELAPEPAPAARPLSIAELTARLESGLARRTRVAQGGGTLADMPVEPAVPVRDHVEQDVDQALRAALSALRELTDRPR